MKNTTRQAATRRPSRAGGRGGAGAFGRGGRGGARGCGRGRCRGGGGGGGGAAWLLSRRRRGAEVIEAALVFPLLLALAFGTVEFGYYFYLEHNLQAAAREGARAGIPGGIPDYEQRGDLAITAAERIMSTSGFSSSIYEITWEVIDDDDGDFFRVSVNTNWGDVNEGLRPMRMIRLGSDDQRWVVGTATMRIEQ